MKKIDVLNLKKYKPLYIIGHKNPDVDTIFSSYLLSNIFNFFGIESYPCILEENYEIDSYNGRIIKDYLNYQPKVIKLDEINKYNFVLVDHNDPIQSLDSDENIVFCIDHHQNSNKLNSLILGSCCANCLFIYKLFKDIYQFSDKEKELILVATFTDTLFLKTNRYKKEDEELVEELNINLDNNELLLKYFIPTDISMGIDNYIKVSDRDFSYLDIVFSSSVIQLLKCNENQIFEYKNAVLNKKENHLGILRDLESGKTYIFFKINNCFKEYSFDYIASRTTVLPLVFDYIESIK